MKVIKVLLARQGDEVTVAARLMALPCAKGAFRRGWSMLDLDCGGGHLLEEAARASPTSAAMEFNATRHLSKVFSCPHRLISELKSVRLKSA